MNKSPSIIQCNNCNESFTSLQELSKHETHHHNLFTCQHCEFQDSKEENVDNHMIATHNNFKCHLCDFTSTDCTIFDKHLADKHYNHKFACTECSSTFHTEKMLREHKSKQHSVHCDYCGFKAENISSLDVHLNNYHKISGKPSHNPPARNTYSERVKQSPRAHKSFTLEEQLRNGPCIDWNESRCRYGDLCKYAHVKICRFQDSCRSPRNCKFYHF